MTERVACKRFEEKVQRACKARGISVRSAMVEAGLPENKISKMKDADLKSGGVPIRPDEVIAIADALGLSVEYLLRDEIDDPLYRSEMEEQFLRAMRAVGFVRVYEVLMEHISGAAPSPDDGRYRPRQASELVEGGREPVPTPVAKKSRRRGGTSASGN